MYSEMLKSAVMAHIANCADDSCGVVADPSAWGSRQTYKYLSGFSNAVGGGYLIFGLDRDDRGHLYVRGIDDPDLMEKALLDQCGHMEPAVKPLFCMAEVEGKLVLSIEVPEINIEKKPCFYRGVGLSHGSYVWDHDGLRRLDEVEIYSYIAYREGYSYLAKPIHKATMADLDRKALAQYCKLARLKRVNLRSLNDKQIMEVQELVVDGHPTRDALLLFGLYPQRFLPGLFVQAVVTGDSDVGSDIDAGSITESAHIEGTIMQMLEQAVEFIERNTHAVSRGESRVSSSLYPRKALEELVFNALVHRDMSFYTDLAPVSIAVRPDSVVIMNPGGIYGRERIEDLGNISMCMRNPYLMNCLEILGVAGVRYTGISQARHAMLVAGLPVPAFMSGAGRFRVVLKANDHDVQGNFRVAADVTDQSERILAYCRSPKTKQQIADYLGLKSVHYVSSQIIAPLVDAGELAMTIPDKPRSKNQRYVAARS